MSSLGGYGGQNRSFALSAIMLVTAALIGVFGLTFIVLFLVTLASVGVYITWLYVPLWTPAIIGFGIYIVATFDTRQMARAYAQSSVLAAVFGGVGTIFMIVAGYYYTYLWLRCVFPWIGNLDTLEKIMCTDEYWVVWITWLLTFVFLVVSLGVFLSAGYDAFTRVSRMNLFRAAQGGLEQTVDVFGQSFQKAFRQRRRRGRNGGADDADLGEDLDADMGEDEPIPAAARAKRGKRPYGRTGVAPINAPMLVNERKKRYGPRNNGRRS